MGNLHNISLAEAVERFHQRVATFLSEEQEKVHRGELDELDHFLCWHCVKYLDKVLVLKDIPRHPWVQA